MAWPMLLMAGIQAGAQIYGASQNRDAAMKNRATMMKQADLHIKQGEKTRNSYYDQAEKIRVQGEAFKSGQRSAIAKSGVKLDSGSPLAVMRETQKALQSDISRTRNAGNNALSLAKEQAKLIREGATDLAANAGKDMFAGFLGAGMTFGSGLMQYGYQTGAWGTARPAATNNRGAWLNHSYGRQGAW